MQILIYTHAFPPMVGGIETITMQLAQRLAESSHSALGEEPRVVVVTPQPDPIAHENELPFQVVRAPSFWKLLTLIRKTDILHISGSDMLPLLLGWLLRKNTVVQHHGFQTACPNGQLIFEPTQGSCPGHFMAGRHRQCWSCNSAGGMMHSFKRWLLTYPRRWLCARAETNVMPTAWLGSLLQLPRMVTIHHGLPAPGSQGDHSPGRIAVSRAVGPPRIAYVGRLVTTKGVHILLKAASQLTDCEFQLMIIGDGPERSRLEADVRSLHLEGRVVFCGHLPTDEVEQMLAGARAVVMPSVAGEVFGLVALENMLRGKVVIVSQIGSLTEVIGDAGLTFPAGDARALAGCVRQVLDSEDFAEKMGARAAARASSLFTPERMVDDHLSLYRRLLGAAPIMKSPLDSAIAPLAMTKD